VDEAVCQFSVFRGEEKQGKVFGGFEVFAAERAADQGKVFGKAGAAGSPFTARDSGQKGKVFGGIFRDPQIPLRSGGFAASGEDGNGFHIDDSQPETIGSAWRRFHCGKHETSFGTDSPGRK
jgi:hypothetical protein